MKNTKSKKPDFICIGPPKTGTTWLYHNLRLHPQVYLTPIKELRYFWEKFNYGEVKIYERWRRKYEHLRYRRYMNQYIEKLFTGSDPGKIIKSDRMRIYLKFLILKHTDEWYFSLFKYAGEKIAGDISPVYYILVNEQIRYINEILPDLKILIFLRNPIEREWSGVKKHFLQKFNLNLSDVDSKKFESRFREHFKKCPGYLQLIRKWEKYFGREKVFVGFYDRLCEEPLNYYKDICRFLGLEYNNLSEKIVKSVDEKVNVSKQIEIPRHIAKFLAKLYKDSIEELTHYYKPYPQRWLEMCEKIMNNE